MFEGEVPTARADSLKLLRITAKQVVHITDAVLFAPWQFGHARETWRLYLSPTRITQQRGQGTHAGSCRDHKRTVIPALGRALICSQPEYRSTGPTRSGAWQFPPDARRRSSLAKIRECPPFRYRGSDR
jgi:hypothetical protein